MNQRKWVAVTLVCSQPIANASAAVTIDLYAQYFPGSTVSVNLTTSTFLTDTSGALSASLTVSKLLKTITANAIKGDEDAPAQQTKVTIFDNITKQSNSIIVNASCLGNAASNFQCSQPLSQYAPQLRVTTDSLGVVTYAIYTYSAQYDDLVFTQSITTDSRLALSSSSNGAAAETRYFSGQAASADYYKPAQQLVVFQPDVGGFSFFLGEGLDAMTNVNRIGYGFGATAVNNQNVSFSPRIRITGIPDLPPPPAPVPEPATWSLLIAGFGMVGAALRRRVAQPRTSPSAA